MPRLISKKNLAYPKVDGQVLSSDSKGIQSWVDNKIIGISTLGSTVGTANTIKFASGVDVSIVAGVASVTVEKASKTVTKYTATANQTTFAATYALGYVDVFLNGVKLSEDQYTATNGTSIVLDEGATVDDIIEIVAFNFATASPTIPTNNNQLTNGAGFITTSFTNTNQLTNGAGFITATSSGVGLSGIVTSIVAGTNVTISDSTGVVTINSSGGGDGSGEGVTQNEAIAFAIALG
jgi:hypothetical protein